MRHTPTTAVRYVLHAVLIAGMIVLSGCGSDDDTITPVDDGLIFDDGSLGSDEGLIVDDGALDSDDGLAPDDQAAADVCAYEGDPTCGYVPDDPVAGMCTPDFAGDAACQSNEDLLNDMADINSNNLDSGW